MDINDQTKKIDDNSAQNIPAQATDAVASSAADQEVEKPSNAIEQSHPPVAQVTPQYEESDVFLWANNVAASRDEVSVELFFMSRNYFLYRTSVGKELQNQLVPLFINGLLDRVITGAGEGLVVRNFEDSETEENVLLGTQLKKVEHAYQMLNLLKTQEHEIEDFVEEQHDLKRIKAVVARCKHPSMPKAFYVVKHLASSTLMKGTVTWMMRDNRFVKFDADGALRIPPENHLLILDQDVYAFAPGKLDSIFGYNAKKYGIAIQKMQEIKKNFKFTVDGDVTLESLVAGKKALVAKLQAVNPVGIKQDEMMKHAEELGIDLITDVDGSILIMDDKDLSKFVNLLNDDYMESPLTGNRYEIKSKKPLQVNDDDQ